MYVHMSVRGTKSNVFTLRTCTSNGLWVIGYAFRTCTCASIQFIAFANVSVSVHGRQTIYAHSNTSIARETIDIHFSRQLNRSFLPFILVLYLYNINLTLTFMHSYNAEYIFFRDGSCAIGMFRAITEINVLLPVDNSKRCTFHCSRVESPHNSKYVNYGLESCLTPLFLSFIFTLLKKCTLTQYF